ASINLMPVSVWEGLSLPELTPTCMTLELADLSVSKPLGIAKDVSFKVGVFHFPADFVVVDFEPDPRVPLILRRCFLKTSRALIDVHKGELSLRIGNEAITYNLDQTVRYSANYNQMTANKIDVVESACEEYSQEVLGFSNVTDNGTPTPQNDLIVSVTFPILTSFGDSDFLLFEEADAFLGLEDDPDSLKINPFYYDPEGDILLLEAILNSEPSPSPLNQEQNLPSFKEELKAYEAQTVKSSVEEPPEVELKDLPHHLEYAFLEGDDKLPVITAKELRNFEPDPRVPLILGRCFLKTDRALIDVHKGELTLRIGNEAITYNLDQTSRYSANYDQMTANKIDVTDEACEEYFQEILGFSNVTASGSPTPSDDLRILTSRVYKDHPIAQIIGDLSSAPQTRSMTRMVKDQGGLTQINDEDFHTCMFAYFFLKKNQREYTKPLKILVGLKLCKRSFFNSSCKSAFLYGTIEEEVYVCQPLGFEDPDYPDKVYKVVKAFYGLHQVPRAWYETLANYLLENGFQKGKIDQTLFIKRKKGDILLVHVYVDDIIFGYTNKELCKAFEKLMKDKFQMSSMDGKSANTPIDTKKPLLKDPDGEDVDVDTYRYLKGKPHLGLWFPKDLPFNLVAYSDNDYARASLNRKSITGGCQFLGYRLISWQYKKQTVVATSSTEAEYVAAASCCAQVLWIQN
nr:uncharacterized mitochondrial protein AtMg00810-like [Tanacetum cinerariifolium]